jgi:hypothetical protein
MSARYRCPHCNSENVKILGSVWFSVDADGRIFDCDVLEDWDDDQWICNDCHKDDSDGKPDLIQPQDLQGGAPT